MNWAYKVVLWGLSQVDKVQAVHKTFLFISLSLVLSPVTLLLWAVIVSGRGVVGHVVTALFACATAKSDCYSTSLLPGGPFTHPGIVRQHLLKLRLAVPLLHAHTYSLSAQTLIESIFIGPDNRWINSLVHAKPLAQTNTHTQMCSAAWTEISLIIVKTNMKSNQTLHVYSQQSLIPLFMHLLALKKKKKRPSLCLAIKRILVQWCYRNAHLRGACLWHI